jgi:hypothetical protein
LAGDAKMTGCRSVHLLTEGGVPDYANSANRIFLKFKFGQWHVRAMKRFEYRGYAVSPAMSDLGVRRAKAALSSGCKSHPAKRSSRKQPEQLWR